MKKRPYFWIAVGVLFGAAVLTALFVGIYALLIYLTDTADVLTALLIAFILIEFTVILAAGVIICLLCFRRREKGQGSEEETDDLE